MLLTSVVKPSFSAWSQAATKVFFPAPGAMEETGPRVATLEPLACTSKNETPTILLSTTAAYASYAFAMLEGRGRRGWPGWCGEDWERELTGCKKTRG